MTDTATLERPRKMRDEPKILSRRVLVRIRRDQTADTPRVIWQHEIPILEEMFGEGNVVVIEPESMDEGYTTKVAHELLIHNKKQDQIPKPSDAAGIGHVFIGAADVEFQRLISAYGMHVEERISNCEKVYGRFQTGTFAKLLGKPELRDLPAQQLRSLITSYAGPDRLVGVSEVDLLKVAEEVGVEIAT